MSVIKDRGTPGLKSQKDLFQDASELEETFRQIVCRHVSCDESSLIFRRIPSTGMWNPVWSVDSTNGTQQGFTPLVLRISNPYSKWKKMKTMNEVAVMQHLGRINHPSLVIPKLYGWTWNPEEFGFEYILMEYIQDSVTLESVWKDVSSSARAQMLRDLVAVIGVLRSITFAAGGSFAMNDDGELEVVQDLESAGHVDSSSACSSVADYFRGKVATYVGEMQTSQDDRILGRISRMRLILKPKFLESVLPPSTDGSKEFALSHCDLNPSNIMVDSKTCALKAVIDWEWAQAAPFDCEVACFPDFDDGDVTPEEQELVNAELKKILIEPIHCHVQRVMNNLCDTAMGLVSYLDWFKDNEEQEKFLEKALAKFDEILSDPLFQPLQNAPLGA